MGSRRVSPASYQRTASNWLFGNNQPHPSFDLHHFGAVAVMFRTILICIALTMTRLQSRLPMPIYVGPYRREPKPLRKRQSKLVAIET